MSTYIAITTTGQAWKVLAYGENRKAVERIAHDLIGYACDDIYSETEHINLRVISKTAAKKFGIDYDNNESWWNNYRDAVRVTS